MFFVILADLLVSTICSTSELSVAYCQLNGKFAKVSSYNTYMKGLNMLCAINGTRIGKKVLVRDVNAITYL